MTEENTHHRRLPPSAALPQAGSETGYTEREYLLLGKCKMVIPASFLRESNDDKILAYIQLVIDDINYIPPLTDYTFENVPPFFDTCIVLGTDVFTLFFQMQKWTLEDFNYTNNGLAVTLDRVAKISTAHKALLDQYYYKVKSIKRNRMSKIVLASPRYQHMLGQFLKVALGEGFAWR